MTEKLMFTFAMISLMNWVVALGMTKKSPGWLKNIVAITAIVSIGGVFVTAMISVWSS